MIELADKIFSIGMVILWGSIAFGIIIGGIFIAIGQCVFWIQWNL